MRHRPPQSKTPIRDSADRDGATTESKRRKKIGPPAEVVFHDEHFIVVNKSSGAWAEESPDEESSVLESLSLQGLIEEDCDAMAVYPMEPPLSGLLLYARTPQSLEAADRLMAADGLNITCRVIVQAHIMSHEGVIRGAIPQRLRSGSALRYIDACPGEPATQWKLNDSLVAFAVLECRPYPAYPSLVRAHLESAGVPLAVDPTFGGARQLMLSTFKAGYHPSRKHPERPLIARVSLHVARLTFAHPFSGTAVDLSAEVPKDFRAALHQLDRFGRIGKA